MVRYVADRTGRFTQRPHYDQTELDRECEATVAAFLRERHSTIAYPLTTEDLTVLIERDTESLDQYADLNAYGSDVEGATLFQPGRKPKVLISGALSSADNRQNRLRMTLAHEYGHVKFHTYLWDAEPPSADLLKANPRGNMQVCFRDKILDAAQTDWMEWQAGYAGGALLMPVSRVRGLVAAYCESHNQFGVIGQDDTHGRALIEAVSTGFMTSPEAARIRLIKLGILGAASAGPSLFASV